jgi:hypothetical protein
METPKYNEPVENDTLLQEITPQAGGSRQPTDWRDSGWTSIPGRGELVEDLPNIIVLAAPIAEIIKLRNRHSGHSLAVESRGRGPDITRQILVEGGQDPEAAFDSVSRYAQTQGHGAFATVVHLEKDIDRVRLVMLPQDEKKQAAPEDASQHAAILDARQLTIHAIAGLGLAGTVEPKSPDTKPNTSVWD